MGDLDGTRANLQAEPAVRKASVSIAPTAANSLIWVRIKITELALRAEQTPGDDVHEPALVLLPIDELHVFGNSRRIRVTQYWYVLECILP